MKLEVFLSLPDIGWPDAQTLVLVALKRRTRTWMQKSSWILLNFLKYNS